MDMKRFSAWLKKCFVPHEGNDFHPHVLRHESILTALFVVIILELGFLVQVFVVINRTNFLASVLPGAIASLTNEERADNGVPPLTESTLLDKAAQEKADDMAANGYFAHTSPSGKTPWYWFQQVGYNYVYAGENLAVNFFESQDVANAWMNSPTHRANIVKPEYTEIGVGVAEGMYQGHHTVFVAQLFGKPLVFAAAPAPTDSAGSPQASSGQAVPKTTPAPAPKTAPTPKPTTTPEPAPLPAQTPTTAPNPNTVSETPTAPVVASAPTPTVTEVLGEESSAAPVQESALRAFFDRALSSPRKSLEYAYGLIAMMVIAALLIVIFIRTELRHPKMLARGAALIGVILLLTYVNLRVLNLETSLPTDDHNMTAAAIEALQ